MDLKKGLCALTTTLFLGGCASFENPPMNAANFNNPVELFPKEKPLEEKTEKYMAYTIVADDGGIYYLKDKKRDGRLDYVEKIGEKTRNSINHNDPNLKRRIEKFTPLFIRLEMLRENRYRKS